MNHFTNQSNGSHSRPYVQWGAIIRRFALFPLMLLMLLLLPARMAAQTEASSSKYIATYDSDTETLTFEKYEGESLPSDSESEWVEDGTSVFDMFKYDCQNIKNIVINESFKTFTPTTLSRFFGGLVKLETITGLEYLNTANVTDMSLLFNNCQKLTSLDVTHFNTAKVTNMYRMFNACGLTSLDLSNFNTAKVENMELMFSGCSNLKTIYASDKFTTAAVTESENMFSYCGSLSGDIDWTSDKATDKTYAKTGGGYFRDKAYDNRPWAKYADGTLTFRCGYKKTLGENEYELNSGKYLPAWNTYNRKISKVVFEASFANARPTNCYAWFQSFRNLTQIEGIENFNTENVTNMEFMFTLCSSLTSLDVTHFNTGNVTSMANMFSSCSKLAELDVTHFNTEKVTSMNGMFRSCKGLISLDVTNFNTANVKDMSNMFYYCYNLKEIYVSDKFVTDAVISSDYMFFECNSLSGDIDCSDKAVDKTYAKTAGGYFRDKAYDNRPWVKYADGTLTFRWGYKKTLGENEYELNSGKNRPKWDTHKSKISKVVFEASFANARPTSCYAWFLCFYNLKQIEGIENLNTANVTNMISMFSDCFSLTSLYLTNFNTEKVTNMSGMFSNCFSLTTIYVSDKFVTTKVSSGAKMFQGCTNLKGFIDYISNSDKDNNEYANYKTGYFSKLVGKNDEEKIGATGETLTTNNLVLVDDKDFVAYEPFAAKAASYSRTMKEGTTWATLCLPFEVSLADKNFRAFKLLSADDVTETVELEEIEGSIAAGTPVIIKMKDGATKLSISEADKAIAKDVQTAETANGNYQLQGIYTQKVFDKDADNNCYIVKGDKLMNPAKLLEKTATKSVGSNPFRAYMVDNSSASAAGARMFSISVGGSTTAIEQLETTADSKAEYYDLQGRRLQNLQKGINIVKRGGKTMKVIIK